MDFVDFLIISYTVIHFLEISVLVANPMIFLVRFFMHFFEIRFRNQVIHFPCERCSGS